MKIKIGKYKNCQKKLKSYGFTEVEARIICAKVAISDTDWEVKEVKKKKSGFETEEEEELEEEEDFGKRTTQAGGKTKAEKRAIVTEPKAMQMPLYQPWRSYKSEHRLQTKLEKVLTAEEKFLTMEQLLKRAEYALAIKKKDSDPFIVYMIPEEIWDQTKMSGIGGTGKTVKEGPYAGQPIIGYFTKGEAHIPIIATPQGPKNVQQAEKEGVKIGKGGATPRVKSINERLGSPRTKQHFEMRERYEVAEPLTAREKEAKQSAEKDIQTPYEELITQLEAFAERTFEIKSPHEKLKEEIAMEKKTINTLLEGMSREERKNYILQGMEIKKIEASPSFNTLGADLRNQNIQWDKLQREDLWAHIHMALNWTTEGKNDEYEQIFMRIGKAPYIHEQNPLNQMQAITHLKKGRENDLVLHDFIVHTKNYYLKEAAHNQLKKNNPSYYKKEIASRMKGSPQAKEIDPARYGYNLESGGTKNQNTVYEEQKAQYALREYERGLYEAKRGAAMFQGDRDRSEKEVKTILKEEREKERETDDKFKIQPPEAMIEELGLLEKVIEGTDEDMKANKELFEWEEKNKALTKAITGTTPLTTESEYESVRERAKTEKIGRWKE